MRCEAWRNGLKLPKRQRPWHDIALNVGRGEMTPVPKTYVKDEVFRATLKAVL